MDKEFLFDVRVVDRMIEAGHISRKDYEKYLKGLPDLAEEAENVEASLADRGVSVEPAKKKSRKRTGAE